MQLRILNSITFHFAFLNKHVKTFRLRVQCNSSSTSKLVGVITTLFVPDVDVLIKILICPSVPSASEILPIALLRLFLSLVTSATCDEASAVIVIVKFVLI